MKRFVLFFFVFVLVTCSAFATIEPGVEFSQGFFEFTGIEGRPAEVLCQTLSVCDERNGKVIDTLHFGDHLIVLEAWDGWARISWMDASKEGWVRSDYLIISPAWYITDESTQVYAYPDAMAPKVALLDKGEKLPILYDDGTYVVVSLRGASGWIKKTPKDTQSATFFKPDMLSNLTGAVLEINDQTIPLTDEKKLETLSQLLTNVNDLGAPMAGCPFGATLTLSMGNGETLTITLATDSCCVYRIDSRDYQYARHLRTEDNGVDNTVLFSLFGVSLF